MGSISAYVTSSGKRYRVIYRKPDHSQTQKRGFKTKRDAELFLANMEVDKSRGAYVDPSKSRVLLGEWLDDWMATRADWQPTSRERARGIVEIHIKPKLGQYPLGALDHQTIQKWAGGLSASQGASSVRKIVNVLSGSLQMAVKDGRLPANPAHGLNLPKVGKPAKRYLNHEQVRDLADAVDSLGKGMYRCELNGYGLLVKILAYCGLRWGEAAAVTLDVYSDLFDSDLDTVSAALDEQILRMDVAATLFRAEMGTRFRQAQPASSAIYVVPPGRFELPPLPPEGSALSPELWGPRCFTRVAASGHTRRRSRFERVVGRLE